MEQETQGTVLSVHRQWWLKVNRKAMRIGPLDGAEFPHIIKIAYRAEEKDFIRRKWLGAGKPVPGVGDTVRVFYHPDRPEKIRIEV